MTFETERSVVALGKSGLALFLPTIWVDKNHIQKGDHVIVEISEGAITVRPKQRGRKPS